MALSCKGCESSPALGPLLVGLAIALLTHPATCSAQDIAGHILHESGTVPPGNQPPQAQVSDTGGILIPNANANQMPPRIQLGGGMAGILDPFRPKSEEEPNDTQSPPLLNPAVNVSSGQLPGLLAGSGAPSIKPQPSSVLTPGIPAPGIPVPDIPAPGIPVPGIPGPSIPAPGQPLVQPSNSASNLGAIAGNSPPPSQPIQPIHPPMSQLPNPSPNFGANTGGNPFPNPGLHNPQGNLPSKGPAIGQSPNFPPSNPLLGGFGYPFQDRPNNQGPQNAPPSPIKLPSTNIKPPLGGNIHNIDDDAFGMPVAGQLGSGRPPHLGVGGHSNNFGVPSQGFPNQQPKPPSGTATTTVDPHSAGNGPIQSNLVHHALGVPVSSLLRSGPRRPGRPGGRQRPPRPGAGGRPRPPPAMAGTGGPPGTGVDTGVGTGAGAGADAARPPAAGAGAARPPAAGAGAARPPAAGAGAARPPAAGAGAARPPAAGAGAERPPAAGAGAARPPAAGAGAARPPAAGAGAARPPAAGAGAARPPAAGAGTTTREPAEAPQFLPIQDPASEATRFPPSKSSPTSDQSFQSSPDISQSTIPPVPPSKPTQSSDPRSPPIPGMQDTVRLCMDPIQEALLSAILIGRDETKPNRRNHLMTALSLMDPAAKHNLTGLSIRELSTVVEKSVDEGMLQLPHINKACLKSVECYQSVLAAFHATTLWDILPLEVQFDPILTDFNVENWCRTAAGVDLGTMTSCLNQVWDKHLSTLQYYMQPLINPESLIRLNTTLCQKGCPNPDAMVNKIKPALKQVTDIVLQVHTEAHKLNTNITCRMIKNGIQVVLGALTPADGCENLIDLAKEHFYHLVFPFKDVCNSTDLLVGTGGHKNLSYGLGGQAEPTVPKEPNTTDHKLVPPSVGDGKLQVPEKSPILWGPLEQISSTASGYHVPWYLLLMLAFTNLWIGF